MYRPPSRILTGKSSRQTSFFGMHSIGRLHHQVPHSRMCQPKARNKPYCISRNDSLELHNYLLCAFHHSCSQNYRRQRCQSSNSKSYTVTLLDHSQSGAYNAHKCRHLTRLHMATLCHACQIMDPVAQTASSPDRTGDALGRRWGNTKESNKLRMPEFCS